MQILLWILTVGLVAFEAVAGIGKVVGVKMAVEYAKNIGVNKAFLSAFGGLELGVAGVLLSSLISKGGANEKLVPWACILLLVLKLSEISFQKKADLPFAAMVGPIFVIVLTGAFYYLRKMV